MKTPRILLIGLSLLVVTSAVAGTAREELQSTALGRSWSYVVYLPPGYETSRLRYPVIYLLHGNAQKGMDWVTSGHVDATADLMIGTRDMPPAIIVMPDAGTTWYVDRKEKME